MLSFYPLLAGNNRRFTPGNDGLVHRKAEEADELGRVASDNRQERDYRKTAPYASG